MADIFYSSRARSDMLDIWLWIAGNSGPTMADTIIDRIEQRISSLGQHP